MNGNVCFPFYWRAVKVHLQPELSVGHSVATLAFQESCLRWPMDL